MKIIETSCTDLFMTDASNIEGSGIITKYGELHALFIGIANGNLIGGGIDTKG